MNARYYQLSHDSFYTRGTPWVDDIDAEWARTCPNCGKPTPTIRAGAAITVRLNPKKGSFWPDALGCGAAPLLIVSRKFVEALSTERLGVSLPLGPVRVGGPLPTQLAKEGGPEYFWIDGASLDSARIDFAKSGFVGFRRCDCCRQIIYDVGGTYDAQHRHPPPPIGFDGVLEDDIHLFTSDLSPWLFFCDDRVVQLSSQYKLTNLRFVPTEWGMAYSGKSLAYT